MAAYIDPCMGGLCQVRGRCPHYTLADRRATEPSERLCLPGKDGIRVFQTGPVSTITIDILRNLEPAEEPAHAPD